MDENDSRPRLSRGSLRGRLQGRVCPETVREDRSRTRRKVECRNGGAQVINLITRAGGLFHQTENGRVVDRQSV